MLHHKAPKCGGWGGASQPPLDIGVGDRGGGSTPPLILREFIKKMITSVVMYKLFLQGGGEGWLP